MALTSLSACGGSETQASGGEWLAPASSSPPSATASPRIKKINSACKLLPAKTVLQVLGSSSGTKLEARELPVDKSDGETAYTCAYGRDGQEPFALTVSTRPDKATGAKKSIDAVATASGVKTTAIEDLGDAGVGYAKDGIRIVVIALPYGKDLRMVFFAAPHIVPHEKLVEVAQRVVVQI